MLKAPSKLCSDCMVGKQHREAIPKKSLWRASQCLQLVHADICGPIKPKSHSNKRYLINFIDDYSRKTWVYFLSEKSETFSVFKKFKAFVERESGNFIRCLHTDRGGEFTSLEFNQFCSANGIARQLTVAYTPQQNGVAERKNRTIMNIVRNMLSNKQIPKEFWPEAVNWAIHVLNRSPTSAVRELTPEDARSGNKPVVDYFRVFGCVAHVHIPNCQRSKLDEWSMRCVLLGVSDESKAYRLYNPITKKIVISRDVVFAENEKWDWKRSTDELKVDVLEWNKEEETENQADQAEEEDVNVENGEVEEGGTTSSSSGGSNEEDPVQGRIRRKPT